MTIIHLQPHTAQLPAHLAETRVHDYWSPESG